MCSPHCRKIKVSQYHTKLCVNTGCESTILFHVGTEDKVRKLSKREKLDKEHDCKRSKIRQALKQMIADYLYDICRQMFYNGPSSGLGVFNVVISYLCEGSRKNGHSLIERNVFEYLDQTQKNGHSSAVLKYFGPSCKFRKISEHLWLC